MIVLSGSKLKNIFAFFFIILLAILLGFRSPEMINNDTETYYKWFTFDVDTIYEQFEWLYSFMNEIAKIMNLPYESVQMTMSCITFIFLFLTFRKEKLNILMAFALYYLLCDYFRSFNIMRQMTAGSIVLYALACLRNNELRKFILCVVIASGIHTTSLIVLPMFLLHKKQIEFSQFVVIISVFLTFILGALNLFKPLIDAMGTYLPRYISGVTLREETFSISKLMMSVFYIYFYGKMDKKSIYTKAYFLGICLMNIITFNPEMMRICFYLLGTQIMVLIHLCKNKNDSKIVWTYCILTFAYLVLLNNMSGVLEYKIITKFNY